MDEKNIVDFAFKGSGVVLKIRKISPLLIVEVGRTVPLPKPPSQEVEKAGGGTITVLNKSDPDYVQLLADRESLVAEMTRKMIVKRGVIARDLTEDEKAQVDELKSFWCEEYTKELEGSDWYIFLNFIAMQGQEDLLDLINAVTRQSQPTEEVIKQNLETFRS